MIRNAKVGERVKVSAKRHWLETTSTLGGVVQSHWPVGATTGTITHIDHYYNQSPSLWVTPDDPAGVGQTRFRPGELERMP